MRQRRHAAAPAGSSTRHHRRQARLAEDLPQMTFTASQLTVILGSPLRSVLLPRLRADEALRRLVRSRDLRRARPVSVVGERVKIQSPKSSKTHPDEAVQRPGRQTLCHPQPATEPREVDVAALLGLQCGDNLLCDVVWAHSREEERDERGGGRKRGEERGANSTGHDESRSDGWVAKPAQ